MLLTPPFNLINPHERLVLVSLGYRVNWLEETLGKKEFVKVLLNKNELFTCFILGVHTYTTGLITK